MACACATASAGPPSLTPLFRRLQSSSTLLCFMSIYDTYTLSFSSVQVAIVLDPESSPLSVRSETSTTNPAAINLLGFIFSPFEIARRQTDYGRSYERNDLRVAAYLPSVRTRATRKFNSRAKLKSSLTSPLFTSSISNTSTLPRRTSTHQCQIRF